jgi:lysophospholipase L1-like esterase
MSRRWFLHLALLASSAGLALVVAELVIRTFDLAQTAGITIADAPNFARIPGVFTPSRRWRDVGFAVRFDASIDSLGYRGAERDQTTAANALRIVFVGDSFAFGFGVQDADAWPAQLEASLACDRPVIVYNAGIPGGSLPEAIAMADRARRLRPDAIVAELTVANDVRDLVGPTLWSLMEARRRAGPLRDFVLRTLPHVGIWNLIRRVREDMQARARMAASPEQLEAARSRYAAMLEEWTTRLRQEGLPVVFAVYPSVEMLGAGDHTLQDWGLATARRAGLDPVDLWPVLARDGRPDDLYLVPRDAHPNRAGYARAATATALAVRSQVAAFAGCRVEQR